MEEEERHIRNKKGVFQKKTRNEIYKNIWGLVWNERKMF